MAKHREVCLGAVAGAHGVRGAVKVKSFTAAPEDVAAYGPVTARPKTAGGAARALTLHIVRVLKPGLVLATAPEIASREDAAGLAGAKLYVDRARLPAPEDADEFYIEDLVGLNAETDDGAPAGEIAAVHDFGAGDLLELRKIPGRKGAWLIRFTRENVPSVNLNARMVTVAASALEEETEEETEGEANGARPTPDE